MTGIHNFNQNFFSQITDDCITCSSKDSVNCAQNPAMIKPTACLLGKSNCYTRVHGECRHFNTYSLKQCAGVSISKQINFFISDGVTYRGCLSEVDQKYQDRCLNDTIGQECMVCENANMVQGCNNIVSVLLKIKNQFNNLVPILSINK